MKKMMLTFALIVVTTVIVAQKSEVQLFRCTSLGISEYNEKTDTWSKPVYKDNLLMIKSDHKEQSYTITGGESDIKIYLIKQVDRTDKIDKDGDQLITTLFNAYDNDASRCTWVIYNYPDYTNINFVLGYSDIRMFLECKIVGKEE